MIPHPVQSAALAHPDSAAVGDWTWASLRDEVARRASAFEPGQVVGLDGPQDAQWITWAYAVGWAGAVIAPLPLDLAARQTALNVLAPDRLVHSTDRHAGPPSAERFWPLDAPRVHLTSSGTTGTPKRIVLTTGQLLFSAMGSMLRLGHLPGDRWLHCLPLHHVGGLAILFRAAWGAAAIERMPFDPAQVALCLDRGLGDGAIHLASFTPAMLSAVLDARPARPFSQSLRALLVGGAATPELLRQRCAAINAPLRETWGMSEAGSQVVTDGAPLAFARVATGADALVIRGPLVPGGLLVTADRGAIDARGQVTVHGRRDDLIISGGVNLDPAAIEAALMTHPGVYDAVVIAVDNARWGQRPVAVCVGRDGVSDAAPDEELKALCRTAVHRFAAPDAIHWWPALPRVGPLRKISRSSVGRELLRRQLLRRQLLRGQLDADLGHGQIEGGGSVEGREVGQPPEGVLERDGAVVAQRVLEGDRAAGAPGDARLNLDGHGVVHGPSVVGLDVHERHAQPQLDQRVGTPEAGVHHLFHADVGVLECAPKEHDPDPINFVKPRGDGVTERHEPPEEIVEEGSVG